MPPSPHDSLLKHALADPYDVGVWLSLALHHRPWSAWVRWTELAALPTEHPRPHDAARSDALFLVPLTEPPTQLLLLLEHQASSDPRAPQRLLAYTALLLERPPLRDLPLAVLPVVLYQGRAAWTAPRTLHQALGLPDHLSETFGAALPQLSYELLDLVRTPALLSAPAPLRVALALLREARAGSAWTALAEHAHLLPEVLDRRGRAYLHHLLEYAYEVENIPPPSEVLTMIAATRQDVEEAFVSYAEQLRREGRAEGRSEGRAEGRSEGRAQALRDVLLRLLRARFGELEPQHLRRVSNAAPEQLDAWIDHAHATASVEALFQSSK